jgi:S-adenosyl methyltransferase
MMEIDPHLPTTARENRAMIHRVIREVVGARGVRQILDLGAGITSSPSVHETAHALAPGTRVAYVDRDPVARAYSLPLLEPTAQGRAGYWLGDFTLPGGAVLDLPGLSGPDGVLDLSEPVLVLFASALHFIPDNEQARGVVRSVAARLVPGSYVMISHITPDWSPETMAALERAYRRDVTDGGARSRPEVVGLVEGMRILEPGVVPAAAWRREREDLPAPPESTVNLYGLVAEVAEAI